MTTIAEMIVSALAEEGVTQVWGVVGDALNPITDAIRRDDRVEWIGVRHEEVAAYAAGAQAQLTGTIGVCMGTVGPGSIHLLGGLYDAKKSHAPVLAICGQVPTAEIGSEYFQEVDNDSVFRDVAEFTATVTTPAQLPRLLEQAVNAAVSRQGVAVLTIPGDVGGLKLADPDARPRFVARDRTIVPGPDELRQAAETLNQAEKVTLLVGIGAREARAEALELAAKLNAPMVLTIKAKEGLEDDNPYAVGQTGLIGNPAANAALEDCDVLFLVGTDFPYRDWYPTGKTVIQLDARLEHIGRRTAVDVAMVGHAGPALRELLPKLDAKKSDKHLSKAQSHYQSWMEHQLRLAEPKHDRKFLGRIRRHLDNPDELIRPEAVAAAVNKHASDDAIFTSDTGMSTVWLSRFLTMRGSRRLLGSFNFGSMANAMPQALGAQILDRDRQVVAFCGDGGLLMLLGDLRTAVTYDLPFTAVVFNNGRLGMVKLEQEEGGLPEFGTVLDNPDIAAVAQAMGLQSRRVTDPDELDGAIAEALRLRKPVLLDVVTNPDEISVPPKPTLDQAWGFAIAKVKESIESRA
ncbi:thiamine pyrophosphate-dependent enzyme [Nocardia brasiliensis]|uniref:Thiamine pyrophosphate protein TPP binding domain-containing protein n=1 Tax=Nocardia brasiliensis (strain ATCC 700358 / HUJEG-1) TaxID=1133849 RepID=K0EY20_NOCB7|nr:thiamine pyrophosphate-dependent enzyme [Nocardia brasiliensis]AFU04753.1 thiamine pyrophosphate protein TPP binding domain-containing protein [Nocardia brasiliensis ATCC 700358]OCF88276.1 thiamine pyrophosphate-binding protein [Nocardia brasiliensis]